MAIDHLDDFVPKGLEPYDLGEAISDGGFHLISLYESPITRGQINGYVVLITNGISVDKYDWTIEFLDGAVTEIAIPTVKITTTRSGKIHWRPKTEGSYKVSVLVVAGTFEKKLTLIQSVRGIDPDLENLSHVSDDRMVPGGNIPTMRRLLYDVFPYVRRAANASEGPTVRVLSALVYSAIIHLSTTISAEPLTLSGAHAKLGNGRVCEMSSWSLRDLIDGTQRLGICRVDPVIFAYRTHLLEMPVETAITPRSLQKAYQALSLETKKDIANRLRFPKQNILVASELLRTLYSDWVAGKLANSRLLGPSDLGFDEILGTLGLLYKKGNIAFVSTRNDNDMLRFRADAFDFFGVQFRSSYYLPVMSVLVEHGIEIEPYANEWEAHPYTHVHFSGGFVQYVWLAPFYREQYGISNLAEWIDNYIIRVLFPPFSTSIRIPIHKDLNSALLNVAIAIGDEKVETMGGFVPRMIGGTSRLSNHAIGEAVDFNYATNPHLKEAHLKALERALRIYPLYGQSQTHAEMVVLNQSFMQWFDDVLAGRLGAEPSISSALYEQFREWFEAGGIMTLSSQLVSVMSANGFQWGGFWQDSRDSMHFDFLSRHT